MRKIMNKVTCRNNPFIPIQYATAYFKYLHAHTKFKESMSIYAAFTKD